MEKQKQEQKQKVIEEIRNYLEARKSQEIPYTEKQLNYLLRLLERSDVETLDDFIRFSRYFGGNLFNKYDIADMIGALEKGYSVKNYKVVPEFDIDIF